MSNLEQYNESVKTYNNLVEKLEGLGVSDDIFKGLSVLYTTALNINPNELFEELR